MEGLGWVVGVGFCEQVGWVGDFPVCEFGGSIGEDLHAVEVYQAELLQRGQDY